MALIENIYTGDGSTVLYSFTFPYIETTDVRLQYDGVDTTAYSLANATTVELVAAPTSGTEIRIYRVTEVDAPAATFFPGSAIRAQDLNDNFEQSLFVVQEASFNTSQSASDSAAALATAQAADVKSDQANVQSAAAEASAAQAAIDAAAAQAVQIGFTPVYNIPGDDQSGIKYLDSAFPIDAAGGVTLPDENSAWADNGAIRYNDSLNKIELYDGTASEWVTAAGGAQIQSTPPNPASEGDVWWDPTDGRGYVYYVDVDSEQWVEMNPSWNGAVIDNSVTTSKIVNGAVTPAKLDRTYLTEVPNGVVTPAKLDRSYLETAGGVLTGGLTVPSLTNGSNNLPIHRGSIDPSQTQSFIVQNAASQAWYPFNPIPDWCKHVQYKIYVILNPEAVTPNQGLYLRYGDASGPKIITAYSNCGMLTNGSVSVGFNDPLMLAGATAGQVIYTYILDLYISDYSGTSQPIWWTTGIGGLSSNGPGSTSSYAMHPIIVPANIDRMGVLLFGNASASNTAWVSQTFMTGGHTQLADFGPTPSPL